MSADRSARELVTRLQSLGDDTRSRLVERVAAGDLDLSSAAQLRSALGLPTLDATAFSQAFNDASNGLGQAMARGIALGASLGPQVTAQPQLVWTAPGAPAAARGTAQVAADLIQHAEQRALVVGYSLTKAAAPFVALLAEAVRRGVACSIVADRMAEKLATLTAHWPPDVGLPPLWTRPPDPGDEQSALHAKFIVVDSRRLLVTSANLTYHGFHGNMEMGVLMEGSVASEAEALVREWSKAGLIRRVGGPGA
jgi:phosphatidylserine/phosphatidylglycerophosphate/cardiolipin synthase-like enzyme